MFFTTNTFMATGDHHPDHHRDRDEHAEPRGSKPNLTTAGKKIGVARIRKAGWSPRKEPPNMVDESDEYHDQVPVHRQRHHGRKYRAHPGS
jgi:hypothetical protein